MKHKSISVVWKGYVASFRHSGSWNHALPLVIQSIMRLVPVVSLLEHSVTWLVKKVGVKGGGREEAVLDPYGSQLKLIGKSF